MRQSMAVNNTFFAFVQGSVRHIAWMAAAAVALLVLAVSSVDVVDTAATASLVVILTIGYFVEANTLADLAPRNQRIFGFLAGGLLGAVAGAVVAILVAAATSLLGADEGVPGGLVPWLAGGAVVGAVLGAGVWASRPSAQAQAWRLPERMRPIIFLTPALLFIGATLVVPTLRTIYLSFRGRRGESDLGTSNYRSIFGDERIFNLDGMGDIVNSRLFLVGMLVLAVLVVSILVRAVATWSDWGWPHPAAMVLLVVATVGLLVIEGWLSSLIWDDALWIALGALVPTLVGLYAMSDGLTTRREVDLSGPGSVLSTTFVAALVLLAMVGALSGVVWNNVFWVVFVTGFSTIIGLAIAVLADRARGESVAKSLIFMPMAISFVGASVIWRFVYAFVPGDDQIGLFNAVWLGFGGEPQTWIQERPWNTLMLIVIMIWIQTGFAMVVLSSAIKAVPTEMLEAARIDGASEAQSFWWVTVPQIRSTITVVVVTLVITVLKVYDIVKVMTNGEFGTNVIANEMFDEVFRNNAAGRGSALAVLLFVAVVPLMAANVRRLRRGEQA